MEVCPGRSQNIFFIKAHLRGVARGGYLHLRQMPENSSWCFSTLNLWRCSRSLINLSRSSPEVSIIRLHLRQTKE